MNTKNILSNSWFKGGILIVAGLFLGWLLFHKSGETVAPTQGEAIHEHSEEEHTIWTCSMHPQIRMEEPGDCPICGMDLIPLQNNEVTIDDDAIGMSEAAMKLAEVQSAIVLRGQASKEVLLYGKIQANEQLLQSQAAHVPGRIEKLMINVTGETVKSGQLIATIYSPELVTAQKELVEALSLKDKYPSLIEAAREKLRNWKLSEEQILEIEKTGKITTTFNIYANTSGVVTERKVNEGDYVQKGAVLFNVVDLSQVWGVFDAYESDLPWIAMNQEVEFTAQAVPGKTFKGKVSFIDPVIDPATRTARVRITLGNPGLLLKPEMFINGIVKSTLKNGGNDLIIPQSAVLWTGTRSVVYVKIPGTEHPTFKMREITLGQAMKDTYVIKEGLEEGEEIVVNGTFSVDAAAQLAGKKTMMNPGGGKVSTGHNHAGMDMSGGDKSMSADEHAAMNMAAKASATDPAFKAQLSKVFNSYIKMKNAFVESNAANVSKEASGVENALQDVKMELLKGDAHMAWMDQLKTLNGELKSIIGSSDIAAQRLAFAKFNDAFYKSLKSFGLDNDTAYYQYCPMANGEKGAYWLSETKEIRNPYFGEDMLGCGETRETLN